MHRHVHRGLCVIRIPLRVVRTASGPDRTSTGGRALVSSSCTRCSRTSCRYAIGGVPTSRRNPSCNERTLTRHLARERGRGPLPSGLLLQQVDGAADRAVRRGRTGRGEGVAVVVGLPQRQSVEQQASELAAGQRSRCQTHDGQHRSDRLPRRGARGSPGGECGVAGLWSRGPGPVPLPNRRNGPVPRPPGYASPGFLSRQPNNTPRSVPSDAVMPPHPPQTICTAPPEIASARMGTAEGSVDTWSVAAGAVAGRMSSGPKPSPRGVPRGRGPGRPPG